MFRLPDLTAQSFLVQRLVAGMQRKRGVLGLDTVSQLTLYR
jgi:hypothetical protein